MSLPINQLGDTYTEDVRALLRNNVPDVAQILKGELVSQTFRRNVRFSLTKDKKFKEGKTYYIRQSTPSKEAKDPAKRVWRHDIAQVTIGEIIPENTYYELLFDEVFLEGYPVNTLPRGYNGTVFDTAFDTRWDDGIGMYKMPLCSTYPNLQGYNVYATPLILEGIASYLVKMNWRLRLLIDGSLSTLIDKFVITKDPLTEVVENNNVYHLYEQTADITFQSGKTYYKRSKSGYYATTVQVGKHVRTQTGYKLTTDTVYQANKEYYEQRAAEYTLSGYKYVLLIEGVNYSVGDTIINPGIIYNPVYNGFNNYYECREIPYPDYYLRKVEADSTTPETSRYYSPIASEAVVTDSKIYYCYDAKSNTFVRCSTHPTDGYQYYTYEYDEELEAYNYKRIDLTDPKWSKPDAFNGITIYRMEFGDYYCVGKGTGCNCLMIGVTKNSKYTEATWTESKLYEQVEEGTSVYNIHAGRNLYIDPTDEDICRIKDLLNLFLTRYRTILLSTKRKTVSLAPIKGDTLYTTTDLITRINSIVTSMKSYADPIEEIGYRDGTEEVYSRNGEYFIRKGFNDYVLINNNEDIVTVTVDGTKLIAPAAQQTKLGNQSIYINAYTARDMKLKVNQIIDFIINESYYFNVFKEDFAKNLLSFEDDFWEHRGVSQLLYDMAVKSDEPPTSRNYNDRWFFYDQSIPYIDEVHSKLNLKALNETPVTGNIKQEPVDDTVTPATYGGYYVYVDADNGWQPLCKVANVYKMADNWSNCNYSGCMQILNLTLNMLNSATPERVSWKEGIHNPKKPVTPEFQATMENVLDQIELMEDRISMLLEYAPHVADIVVDIGYHVTTQFKMSMEESIPVREEADTYISGKVYSYYSATEHKYRGVVINSATEFEAQKLLHGTLYTWNFYHNKK